MRILLSYATDPLVHSDGPKPQARENVEASARKLLSELFELSDTTPDPSLPKRAVKIPRQKEQSQKVIGDEKQYQNVEMKKGDWICSKYVPKNRFFPDMDWVSLHFFLIPVICKNYKHIEL